MWHWPQRRFLGPETALADRFTFETVETVDSTNRLARLRVEQGAGDGYAIRADSQTGGVGREGRVWESPAGNLYASFIVRSSRPLRDLPQLSFVCALAVRRAVIEAIGPEVAIGFKWPNDVLVEGRKISGILIETAGDPIAAILGIGINITQSPVQSRWPAIHLGAVTSVPPSPERLAILLGQALDHWISIWEAEGFAPIRTAWMVQAIGVGGPMLLRTAHEETEGRFMDLELDGTLLMALPDGSVRRVAAGDVTPLVAAG
jgi:BirA family biotin operon repressor/biotin-[acetyl-CoA-carboxylase] ligase